ncbi:MAG TPA: hypothetical protein VKV04_19150 [Verrucomicrobiae bacterium]|nr:hypothetical protein [Verrucomicrobiae bacterium]
MQQHLRFRCAILAVAVCAAAGLLHYLPRDGSHLNTPAATQPTRATEAAPISPDTATVETFPTPDTSATDEELLKLARGIASRSPQHAIDWARAQTDETLRRRCLVAAIRAWGERNPNAAVDWALTQPEDERQTDLEAALAGAVTEPQVAVAIVRGLLKYYDPADHVNAAPALVVALNNAGQFQTAFDFINNDAPADLRTDLTRATFQSWGASQPQEAIQALNAITDEALREYAFSTVITSWSAQQPAAVANYVTSLPEGDSRKWALATLVDNWSLQDPAAFATWLNTSPPGVDLDQAIATFISKTDSANGSPQVAMQWAERISDSDLRYNSIKHILADWNQADPSAAQTYLASTSSLDDQQRQALLRTLQAPTINASN